MERRLRLVSSLAVNIILVLLEANMAYHLLFHYGESFDFSVLRYYHHYSNLFILVSSVILVFSIIDELRGRTKKSSYGVRLFRFMAVTSELLTAAVVVFIRIPINNFTDVGELLFDRTNFLELILCPVLSFLSFRLFNEYFDFSKREALLSSIPTALYSVVMVLLNYFNIIRGPYIFLLVHNQPVWVSVLVFSLIIFLSYVIAGTLSIISRREYTVSGRKSVLKQLIRNFRFH